MVTEKSDALVIAEFARPWLREWAERQERETAR